MLQNNGTTNLTDGLGLDGKAGHDTGEKDDCPIKADAISAEVLVNELNKFDYIRLCFTDLNGAHMTKLVSTKYARKIAYNGTEIYSGMTTFGTRNEIVNIPEVVKRRHPNGYLRPFLDTLHPVTWLNIKRELQQIDDTNQTKKLPSENNKPQSNRISTSTVSSSNLRIGAIICDILWPDYKPQAAYPRYLARKLLHRLQASHQAVLFSAYEPEFRVFKPDSIRAACLKPVALSPKIILAEGSKPPVPVTLGEDLYKTGLLTVYEEFFLHCDEHMRAIGVSIQDFSNENGDSQLEAPLTPEIGIRSADSYFKFKQSVREIAMKHNLFVSFMTSPMRGQASSGCHFNHSILHEKTKRNLLYDPGSENLLSKFAMHWIAGIVEHMPALMAICSPSVNCYRRLNRGPAPGYANWDIENRFVSLRVKNRGEDGTYMENRLPSSASSPYLVMAATLAAGMDGVKRELDPPRPGLVPVSDNPDPFPNFIPLKDATQSEIANLKPLPSTLQEALNILKADKHLINILGEEFIDWYTQIKERGDMKTLENIDMNAEGDESLAAERYQYLEYA